MFCEEPLGVLVKSVREAENCGDETRRCKESKCLRDVLFVVFSLFVSGELDLVLQFLEKRPDMHAVSQHGEQFGRLELAADLGKVIEGDIGGQVTGKLTAQAVMGIAVSAVGVRIGGEEFGEAVAQGEYGKLLHQGEQAEGVVVVPEVYREILRGIFIDHLEETVVRNEVPGTPMMEAIIEVQSPSFRRVEEFFVIGPTTAALVDESEAHPFGLCDGFVVIDAKGSGEEAAIIAEEIELQSLGGYFGGIIRLHRKKQVTPMLHEDRRLAGLGLCDVVQFIGTVGGVLGF